MRTTECPKCQGKLAERFIRDEGYGMVYSSKRVNGPSEKYLESYARR